MNAHRQEHEPPEESEELDGVLRNLSRSMPNALIRAVMPGARFVMWEDTQLAERQRRMDRCVLVQRGTEQIRLHFEWQTEWSADLPFRIFEYQALELFAVVDAHVDRLASKARHTPFERVRIESHVVLLTGREEPWPERMEFRHSPDGEPFAGARFCLHAVYQRTAEELLARGPLFAIFAPLARDASASQASGWLQRLRKMVRTKRRYTELASAMVAIAKVDRRQRQLEQVILGLLPEDIQMNNALYNLGLDHGLKQGRERELRAIRQTITDLCEAYLIEVDDERRTQLDALDLTGLEALRVHLKKERAWPAG